VLGATLSASKGRGKQQSRDAKDRRQHERLQRHVGQSKQRSRRRMDDLFRVERRLRDGAEEAESVGCVDDLTNRLHLRQAIEMNEVVGEEAAADERKIGSNGERDESEQPARAGSHQPLRSGRLRAFA
jgi:hypothetical protein